MRGIPNLIAAKHVMLNSPMVKSHARARGWVDENDQVNWNLVEEGLPDFTLSGGELRLATFALSLAQADVCGLNGEDYDVMRDAFVLAAEECSRLADDVRATMARVRRG